MTPNLKAISLVRNEATSFATLVVQAIKRIHGASIGVDEDALLVLMEAFVSQHPWQHATKRQAAVHEAGHLIAFQFDGMTSGEAWIEKPLFELDGWGGRAVGHGTPSIEDGRCYKNPNVSCRAREVLAGPLAEAVLGNGCALSSIYELIEAKLLAERAAELSTGDKGEVWRETLLTAAAIVERHADEIEKIAGRLMRRGRVHTYQASTTKILSRVRKVPAAPADLSTRSLEVVRLIEAAVPCVMDMQWVGVRR